MRDMEAYGKRVASRGLEDPPGEEFKKLLAATREAPATIRRGEEHWAEATEGWLGQKNVVKMRRAARPGDPDLIKKGFSGVLLYEDRVEIFWKPDAAKAALEER